MKTEKAIVFNKASGQTKEMTATEFEELHRGNEALDIFPSQPVNGEDVNIVSPDNAVPLTFRRSYYRNGREEFVRACWVRPEGFGDQDHIFNRSPKKFKEAVLSGQPLLLSLNMKLNSSPISFRSMVGNGAKKLENWVSEKQGSYISVSVNSIQDTVKALKRFRELAGYNSGKKIFTAHEGAVVPFERFFIGTKHKMARLYDDMQRGVGGIPIGDTRFVGFPCLMPFIPAGTTVKSGAEKGIKGNHIKAEKGKPYLTQLVFEKHDDLRYTEPYHILKNNIVEDPQAIYVLATPSITRPLNGGEWRHMRLNIENIERATLPIDPDLRDKLLRHCELEEQAPYRENEEHRDNKEQETAPVCG